MTGPTDRSITPDHELLVAYLDGELDSDQAQQVERRLSQDEDFRQLLRGLQETWDLLDELPQPTLDEGFTRTTVEMVAVRLSDEIEQQATVHQRRRWLRSALLAAATVAGLAAGFATVRRVQERDDRELLTNLPLIERVDMYSQVDDLEFLQALASTGLFDEDLGGEVSNETR
jgi:anti-sigma factor RsiW